MVRTSAIRNKDSLAATEAADILSVPEACKFLKDYYTPERATVVIAGGVDVDKAVEAVQKWFGKIPKRASAPRTEVKPFTPPHHKQEIEADVERPSLWIGWALPPRNTPDGEAAEFGVLQAFFRIAQKSEEYGFAYRSSVARWPRCSS